MIAADLGVTVANASRLGVHAGVLLRALENRAALAALEFEEARRRLQSAVVWSLLSSLALVLAGVTGTAIVAAIFWDTPQRVPALVILGGLEIAGAATGIWYVISHFDRRQLFELSRDQLAKDAACLREILTSNQR